MSRSDSHQDHPGENDLDRIAQQLDAASARLAEWVQRVRPEDGTPGRFRWALTTTRPANVASTSYVLGGLQNLGLWDQALTDADKLDGRRWIEALHVGNEQYRDPALHDRKSPGWPASDPWPSPAMQNVVNSYARGVLLRYRDNTAGDLPPSVPPPGWPQADDPAAAVEWIKTRPWDTNAWGAGSHAMRMATYLLEWYQQGRAPLDPLIQALKFFYRIQNPRTGLWGAESLPRQNRINGTFKLFPLIRGQLDLPLPHADKIIDQVLAEFRQPNYDETVGGCDEWDNWYVIGLAADRAPGHRADEIRAMAAHRVNRILALFAKPDGGWSYSPQVCGTEWVGFDMAPAIPQGDALALATHPSAVSVCVDLLGIQGRTRWSGQWRMRSKESPELRAQIEARVFGK